jgi:hypothetical protein
LFGHRFIAIATVQCKGVTGRCALGRQVFLDTIANALNVCPQAGVIEVIALCFLSGHYARRNCESVDGIELAKESGQQNVLFNDYGG